MELIVSSPPSIDLTTISPLLVDGAKFCDVLEDDVREVPGEPVSEWKVQNQTAIPSGRYKLTITFSPHFQKDMILVNDVPGFSGVRMHSGDTVADTDGCLIVGNRVSDTEVAGGLRDGILAKLQALVQAAIDSGDEVWLTISRTL